jgi:hypothetical protein
MAKNRGSGGGRRGAIRDRIQMLLPNGHYAKLDRTTGEILAVKADYSPFKGVVIDRSQFSAWPGSAGDRVVSFEERVSARERDDTDGAGDLAA